MPLAAGQRAIMPALVGTVARVGATRVGYVDGRTYVTIAGVHYMGGRPNASQKVRSLSITENVGEAANTASASVEGVLPSVGQEFIVTIGSKNSYTRLFAGQIMQVAHTGTMLESITAELSIVDWTPGANRRKVTGYYTGDASTIAAQLVADYAPSDYTADRVEAGLPTVDGGITFTQQDLSSALSQLARRVGAYWYWDYFKRLTFFTSQPTLTNPVALTVAHESVPALTIRRDLSQVVTRAIVEGYGSTALGTVVPGATMIPVVDPSGYATGGGTVVAGPQKITYTGVHEGGGGTLVGPGAAPSAGPTLALANGAGVESGEHDYAATFVTAAGESLPSPIATIVVGLLSPPTQSPIPAPALGAGVDTGLHDYLVTFVTAVGETTHGPAGGFVSTGPVTAGGIADPSSGPTTGTPTEGGGVTVGTHDYVTTFTNAVGETAPGPNSDTVTTVDGIATPSVALTMTGPTGGGNLSAGAYKWKYTYVNGSGETDGSPVSNTITSAGGDFATISGGIPAHGTATSAKIYRTLANGSTFHLLGTIAAANFGLSFSDGTPDASIAANPTIPTSNPIAPRQTVPLSNIPIGPTGTTSRKIYRRFNGSGAYKLALTIANNTATTATDTVANGSLGADAPAANTTATTTNYNQVALSNIQVGGALVTSRKVYRRFNATGTYKLALTIANNTATTAIDATPNASLGADSPATNTAAANRVDLTNIPIGPSGTIGRNIYRTVANGSQLKLRSNIGNNTATSLQDTTPDASLTTDAPASDTSGLEQPSGQVPAGSTSILVAGAAAFSAAGGWAVIGNGQQVIRYTGITDQTLTGVPASGNGSIAATIAYNSTITAAPALVGVPASGAGAIRFTINRGDDVNVLVQVDDVAAQTTLAALAGGDGIQEEYIQDRRLSIDEAIARGTALLEMRSEIAVEASWSSRDVNTRAGRTITITLGAPFSVTTTLLIQQATIDDFHPLLQPTFTAHASSQRFSFEDLLRRAREAA